MSRWAADLQQVFSNSTGAEEGVVTSSPSNTSESWNQGSPLQQPRQPRFSSQNGLKLFLPVLSAFSYMSALFSLFSPAPLLILFFLFGRKWTWLGILGSAFLVGLLKGSFNLAIYLIFVLPIVLVMTELLKRKSSLEKTVAATWVSICVVGIAFGLAYARVHSVNPWTVLNQELSQSVDQVVQSIQESGKQVWVDSGELEEWKSNVLMEMPSGVAILALLMIWANLMILLRANPRWIRESLGLKENFYREWKAPAFLVWPTIVAGFFLIVEVKYVSLVALNVFWFLMSIYAIHGLSVLSYFFEAWNVRKSFRGAGFGIAAFLMRPLLLALGFFDLWFDFRSKIRQS